MPSLSSLGSATVAVALLFTSFTVGCGSDSGTIASVDELFEQGPFEVGYREMTITYSAAASMKPRELVLRVWYPAQSDSGAGPAQYAVGGVVDLPSPFALDAPPVIEENDLPLVIHSHGNGGEGLLAYPYGELMASHGWVLVAPNHTGNTAFDFVLETADPFTLVALDRPIDITALIDELESGLSGDELAGKTDTSRVFVFGHSFGGYTTFTAGGVDVDFDALDVDCSEPSDNCDVLADPNVEAAYRAGFGDSRVVALAPQAPAVIAFGEGELGALGVPTMLMTARLDQTTTQEESAEPAWAGLDHPNDLWVEMPMGAHYSFITVCHELAPEILALFISGAEEDGCGEDFIPTAESVPVLAAYVLAFGRRHVLGETEWGPILRGPALGDGFVVTVKQPTGGGAPGGAGSGSY